MVGHPRHTPLLTLNPQDTTLNSISPNDIVVAVPPEHYMEESSKEIGKFTPRIYFTERSGDRSILGSNFIMGHEVLFDTTRGRVGFAESHCDYERYIVEKGELLQALMDGSLSQGGSLVDGQEPMVDNVPLPVAPMNAAPQEQVSVPNNGQVGLDALATGLVQGNNAPADASSVPQDVESKDESALATSGWSRKTLGVGGLRQEIRIPG
jgi:hypothetical protein